MVREVCRDFDLKCADEPADPTRQAEAVVAGHTSLAPPPTGGLLDLHSLGRSADAAGLPADETLVRTA